MKIISNFLISKLLKYTSSVAYLFCSDTVMLALISARGIYWDSKEEILRRILSANETLNKFSSTKKTYAEVKNPKINKYLTKGLAIIMQ